MSTQLRFSIRELIESIRQGLVPHEVEEKLAHLQDLTTQVERQRTDIEEMGIKESSLEKHVSELESHIAEAKSLLNPEQETETKDEGEDSDYYGGE